jgi:hypothetical protein
MNKKQLYELTITEKLEQLTVPDMVDAIWARIETQLDIDMPTDDGPPEPPTTPTTGPGKWISAVFFIAVITILFSRFYNKQKNNEISIDQPVVITPNMPLGNGPPQLNKSPGNKSEGKKVVNQNKDEPAFMPGSDSIFRNNNEPDNIIVQPDDSIGTIQPITESELFPPVKSEPVIDTTRKKPKGVKGITDADYRIIPKKDGGG